MHGEPPKINKIRLHVPHIDSKKKAVRTLRALQIAIISVSPTPDYSKSARSTILPK